MACINAATIVAEGNFTGLTNAMAATAVYTVPSSGLYRITCVIQQVSGSSQIYSQASWTDSVGSTSATVYFSLSSDTRLGSSIVIQCEASTTIDIYTSLNNISATYNVFYVVEEI